MKSYMIIDMINSLYEQLVHYKEEFTRKEGILFLCTIDAECHGYENDGNTHHEGWQGRCMKYIHVLILNGHQVYTHVEDEYAFGQIPQTGWKNTSNHDSCWRNGSHEITSLGFECWDVAHKNCPKEHRPSTRDQSIRFGLGFGCLGNVFKIVEVEKEDYGDGYHYILTKVDEIKSKLIKDI